MSKRVISVPLNEKPIIIIYIYNIYIYTCIHTYIWTCDTYIHTYVHTYIHTYIHVYNIHTYIHTYTHTFEYLYIYIYLYTYIHMNMYTYIHTYIQYTYIHTYIHTYVHTYIHTYINTLEINRRKLTTWIIIYMFTKLLIIYNTKHIITFNKMKYDRCLASGRLLVIKSLIQQHGLNIIDHYTHQWGTGKHQRTHQWD